GSPQALRISARTRSRSLTAAFQSRPSGAIGAAMVTATGARRRYQVSSRNTERTPRSATGTTGICACAAVWKAPVRKGRRPVCRWSLPSAKTMRLVPSRGAGQLVGVLGALLHVEALDELRAEAAKEDARDEAVLQLALGDEGAFL